MRIHLDTDLGGDPDDACALAMLLGRSDVEVIGITTNLDAGGRRAGCVSHVLALAGRDDIPVTAGAGASLTTLERFDSTWGDARYWPESVQPLPAAPGAALDLLHRSIEQGATVVAIGAYTNLALLEVSRPGSLDRAKVVVMGGWVRPPAAGLPDWGPARDFNVQCDTRAAEILAASGADLTLVTLPATMTAHLREIDLDRLRAAGPVGRLLAEQSKTYAVDRDRARLASAHPGLPDDLLNFHWDPVTCAVAWGWPGAVIEDMTLKPHLDGDVLRFREGPDGRSTHVMVDLDAAGFRELWLAGVEALAG